MAFARDTASPAGRGLRIAAGIALVATGLVVGGPGGIVSAVVGLAPIYAWNANVRLIAPILRAPYRGSETATRVIAPDGTRTTAMPPTPSRARQGMWTCGPSSSRTSLMRLR